MGTAEGNGEGPACRDHAGPRVTWGLLVRQAEGFCLLCEPVEAGRSQNRSFRKQMQRDKRVGAAPLLTWLTPTREQTRICLHAPRVGLQMVPWGTLPFPPLKHRGKSLAYRKRVPRNQQERCPQPKQQVLNSPSSGTAKHHSLPASLPQGGKLAKGGGLFVNLPVPEASSP